MKKFKKKDKVEIIGNIPFDLLTKKRIKDIFVNFMHQN